MNRHLFQRILCWLLVLSMVLGVVPVTHAAPENWKKIDLELESPRTDLLVQREDQEERDPEELVRVSIVLEEASTVEAGYSTMGIAANAGAMAYRARLRQAQSRMENVISAQVLGGKPLDVVWNMTLVGNIISAWVPYGQMDAIEALPGIRTVVMETQFEPCVVEREEGAAPNAYASSAMTGTGMLWSSGYTGAGSRIAIIDTGTDTGHQSFDNGAYLYALQQNAAQQGMSLDAYMDSLDLLTQEEIRQVLPELNAHSRSSYLQAGDLYVNEKLPFGYNYVDRNLNIDHMYDQEGEHGSHVAGIATANRYIPQGNGYVDARDSVMVLGAAPDAQLITMKVFGQNTLYESDYMAAIEDAIVLGCDAVNLSLGTSNPGSPHNNVYKELLQMMTRTDTVVCISAGNSYSWPETTDKGYLYHDDVSFNTVGEPGSYGNAFTVASVDNAGSMGNYFQVGDRKVVYVENLGFGNAPMTDLDVNGSGTEYGYVFLDGLGYPQEYDGIDVSGKIVMVSRGTLNFVDKANTALDRGAVAVVIYNNEAGTLNMDVSGLYYYAPVVSITREDAAAIRAASTDRGTYLSGKLTVSSELGVSTGGASYYSMSDYSSWGVPGDLSLKPEITAPGGNIYSVWGSNTVTGGGYDQYRVMSGTSMAAPQVTGMTALMAQVYRQNGLAERSGLSPRQLAQSLLMSTAQPLYEEESGGNYYSLLKQGAGLIRVDQAARAESFVLVEGQNDGKVKAELGDDPDHTGVYQFTFTIHNLTDKAAAYTLDAEAFRQDVFEHGSGSGIWLLDKCTTGLDADVTFSSPAMSAGDKTSHDLNGDGVTSAADADFLLEYLLGNEASLSASGDLDGDGVVNSYDAHLLLAGLSGDVLTVPANGSAEVTVRMALTAAAKAELDEQTPKGTYVQAFVYARAVASAEGTVGTTHSIPVLAFYGNWTDPSMFDRSSLMELRHDSDAVKPYLSDVLGSYVNYLTIRRTDGEEYYFGDNPYAVDKQYLPQRIAFNSVDSSVIYNQYFSLIRGAADSRLQITNADTGEIYFEQQYGEIYPAYYNINWGDWMDTEQGITIYWSGDDARGNPVPEGTRVNVSMVAAPYYYRQEDGSCSFEGLGAGAYLTTTMTIDNTAPEALEIDTSRIEEGLLTVRALDNEYVAAVALVHERTNKVVTAVSPNQTSRNAQVEVELDLDGLSGNNYQVAVIDYAGNMTGYQVELNLPEQERGRFTAFDCNTNELLSFGKDCNMTEMSVLNIYGSITAASYADGCVFAVSSEEELYMIPDEDPTSYASIGSLDPYGYYSITAVTDMAYNYADGQMYLTFYSSTNSEAYPYLATVDLGSGELNVLGVLPIDALTLAIDGTGTCWSAVYGSTSLYKYRPQDVFQGVYTYVGSISVYACSVLTSMAWDHERNELYYTYPNALLRIDTATAYPELLGSYDRQLVGLYFRSGASAEPVDRVDSVQLSDTTLQLPEGSSKTIKATVQPWNASDRTVSWSSSNPNVATVDGAGTVTGVSAGTCTITAVSNLDPSVSASCTVTCIRMDKTLRGVIFDEVSKTWVSEFNTGSLPSYTKLHSEPLDLLLGAATLGQDGNLYAASMDLENLRSNLYRLDPVTFQPTLVGSSTDAYMDLAPAPGHGENTLGAIYGTNFLLVDGDTGDYYEWYNIFDYNLVGIAYVGTETILAWGYYETMVDWYFFIDQYGGVYLWGFLEIDGDAYYMEHEVLAPNGVYGKLNFQMETPYFGSAYFDGQMLYFSAYMESEGLVKLMAMDVAGGTKECYELGDFGARVWPVAGLMEPDTLGGDIGIINSNAAPIPVERKTEVQDIYLSKLVRCGSSALEQKTQKQDVRHSGQQSLLVPLSGAEVKEDLVYVDVTIPAAGTNAEMTVTFDASLLELADVSGLTNAFAWNAEKGRVELAFAEHAALAADARIARLTFRSLGTGVTSISIDTHVLGQQNVDLTEKLSLNLDYQPPHDHDYTAVVTEPTCTQEGYTTYTCDCGDSFVSNYVSALGHDLGDWQLIQAPTDTEDGLERRFCSRCDYSEDRTVSLTADDRDDYFSDEEWEVLKLVNKERRAQGLSPLTGFALLQQVGGIRAEELVELFSHTRPDGRDCYTAYDEVGVEYWSAGENIAAGYTDPYDVMDGWMNSPGHRANILDADFESVGVGYYYDRSTGYRHHWSQNFRGMYGRFTGYQVVIPRDSNITQNTDFDAMDIYLVLEYSEDDFVHYLPLTQELVSSITVENNTMTVTFSLLGLSGSFTVGLGHTHTYTAVVTPPTCTEPGFTTYTCTCGDSYVADYVDALGHDWSDWEIVEEPTCTEYGTERRTCSCCGYAEERQVEALGHNWSDWETIEEATCTEDGYEARFCYNCGEEQTNILTATGHDWSDWETIEEATCTEDGYEERFCFNCGEEQTNILAATGHDWSDWETIEEATCTEDGYEERFCFNCGEEQTNILAATGHDWSDWETIEEATCTEDGYEERFCYNCDEEQTNILTATGHDWSDWETIEEATCTEDGYEERFCFNCGEEQTNILAAIGHDWSDWVVIEEPTITAPGLKSRMCFNCLYVDLETIPELEHTHSYTDVVTAPTCTQEGYTTYTCECGDSYVGDYVEALGHDLGQWYTVKEPTCTETGTEQRDCSRCDHHEDRVIEARDHSYTGVITEPTCTEQGYTTYTCTACGDSYFDFIVGALGHDLGQWYAVKAPTCTETGVEQRDCSRCDYAENRVAEATGHSHSAVVTEPTCTQAGFTTYTCTNCGNSYVSDYVDALGHAYVDGTCTRCGAKDPNYQKPAQNPFIDVPEGSFYYEPVLWAVENGITSGTSATTFNPTGDCQRAQVVTFLWRAAGKPEPSSTVNPFVDVKETDFYYKAVLWAVEKGITNGVDATHFGPFAYCNRAQVVTFLYRAMGSPEVSSTNCPFTDVVAGAWYEAPILWAVENGITNGMDATHFGVNVICNRAQVVTFLYRTLA